MPRREWCADCGKRGGADRDRPQRSANLGRTANGRKWTRIDNRGNNQPRMDANGHEWAGIDTEVAQSIDWPLRPPGYCEFGSAGLLPFVLDAPSRTKLSATPNTKMPMAQNASPLRLAMAQFTLAYIMYRQPIASNSGVTG